MRAHCVSLAAWLALAPLAALAAPSRTRIDELREHVEEKVSVRGRAGQIVEAVDRRGEARAYTLRDDYGLVIDVRTDLQYPTMGMTYTVAGVPRIDPETGQLFVQESSRVAAYPRERRVVEKVDVAMLGVEEPPVSRWLATLLVAVVVVGAGVVFALTMLRLPAVEPPALPDQRAEPPCSSGQTEGGAISVSLPEPPPPEPPPPAASLEPPLPEAATGRRCGAETSRADGSKCPAGEEAASRPAESALRACPRCGREMPVGAANCLSCGRSTGHRRPPRPQETTLRLEPGRPSRVEVRFNQRDPSRVLQGEPTRRPPEPNRAPQVEAKPRQPEPVGAPQVKATSHQSGLTGAPQVEVEPRPPEPGPASHVEVSFRHREPNDASQEEPTRRPPEPDRAPQAAARPPCTSAAQAPGDAVTVEAGGLALTRGMEHLRAASAQSPQGPPTVPRRAPATMAVVSFLVPLFGFVYSAIMLTSDDPTKAREGQLTLGASLLACVTLAAVLGGYLIAH